MGSYTTANLKYLGEQPGNVFFPGDGASAAVSTLSLDSPGGFSNHARSIREMGISRLLLAWLVQKSGIRSRGGWQGELGYY